MVSFDLLLLLRQMLQSRAGRTELCLIDRIVMYLSEGGGLYGGGLPFQGRQWWRRSRGRAAMAGDERYGRGDAAHITGNTMSGERVREPRAWNWFQSERVVFLANNFHRRLS